MNALSTNLRESLLALDTNIFIYAFRPAANREACRAVFEQIPKLRIFLPLRVLRELTNTLSNEEISDIFKALHKAVEFRQEFAETPLERIQFWESRGAKKGDAVICASLESADVKVLVSENRHFLLQISDLPFQVLGAQDVLDSLFSP